MWLHVWLIAAVVTAVLAARSLPPKALRLNVKFYWYGVSDAELQNVSDAMFKADANNMAQYITVTYKPDTNVVDKIQLNYDVDKLPTTYRALGDLIGLYPRNFTEQIKQNDTRERAEKNFVDAVLKTEPMQILFEFWKRKGLHLDHHDDRLEYLWRIWFTPIRRLTKAELEAHRKNSSLPPINNAENCNDCGFSHVYLGSEDSGHMRGYPNWYVMLKEQASTEFREEGSWEYKDSASKKIRAYLKKWKIVRHNNTMKDFYFLLGVNPELQMALDTLCFIFRRRKECKLSVDDPKFFIKANALFTYGNPNWDGFDVVRSSFVKLDPAFNAASQNHAPKGNN